MISNKVNADELGRMLFGSDEKPSSKVRTRSIYFEAIDNVANPHSTNNTVTVKIVGLPINFISGTTISPDYLSILDKIGKLLTEPEYSNKTLVNEGRADTVGNTKANRVISGKHAKYVKQYISSNFNINPNRVRTV